MDNISSANSLDIRLIQFRENGEPWVGLVRDAETIQPLTIEGGTYELAQRAIRERRPLCSLVESLEKGEPVSYQGLVDAGSLLPPIAHPDPSHCCVSGTGLTHLGSADTRDSMHVKLNEPSGAITDSMKMFKLGLEGDGRNPEKLVLSRNGFTKGTEAPSCRRMRRFKFRRSPSTVVKSLN